MASRITADSATPTSVQDLALEAENFDFYVQQPLLTWLRSAATLRRQAAVCEQEDDLKLAFLYTYRHLVLVLNKIPQYTVHERTVHKRLIKQEKEHVVQNLARLESWKPKLQVQYEKELQAQHARRSTTTTRATLSGRPVTDTLLASQVDDSRELVNDTGDRDIAASLARQELLRRHGSSERQSGNEDDASMMLQHTRQLMDHLSAEPRSQTSRQHAELGHYPSFKREASVAFASSPPVHQHAQITPPQLPSKVLDNLTPQRSLAEGVISSSQVKFRSKASTEGGEALRPVFLPSALQQTFLDLAHSNTARDLETCGVLCASLVSNALIITHLVIPDQTSTSDTCDTTEVGDVALYEYCEEHNLISCGWIHTHPSQTCFLSSRDLHTSAAYQQMLPEAIAIVCAPRHNPSLGIFRLTSPPGLPAILRCQLPGLFHQHEESKLYTDATSPGHVIEDSKLEFKVMDLRAS